MSAVARFGDVCGAAITATGVKLMLEGKPVALIGDRVTNHGDPDSPHHNNPTMAHGAAKLRIGGVPVCRAGDQATCGHSPVPTSVKLLVAGDPVTE
jgi:uncharacterized Zn-binding protein involved in type VI secretion